MEEFYTRQKANEGVKLPLVFPDGSPSEEWVIIRHIQSDAFRETLEEDSRRKLIAMTAEDDEKLEEPITHIDLLVSLISDWSFESKLTDANKKQLLTEAPQIADYIDKFATDKKRFFARPSKDSTSSSKKKQS